VIEIDPAVYDAARRFFELPNLTHGHNIILEDAREWIERRRTRTIEHGSQADNDTPFTIVVHDCFSGGGVPKHLFTVEFWESLKSLVHQDGLIAVASSVLFFAVIFK